MGRGSGAFTIVLYICCGLTFVGSLSLGAQDIPVEDVWAALTNYDNEEADQTIVRGIRLPRALTGLLCGAALGVAGVIMQKLTRNPLADPGLMGVNAGAALAIVMAIWCFGPQHAVALAGFAILGAAFASFAVWRLAGGTNVDADRGAVLRLPLAGTAISAFCMSVVAAAVLLSTETRENYRFWMIGSLGQADISGLTAMLPVFGVGLLLSVLSARHLDVLELGGDVASGLGLHPGLIATLSLGAVTSLSGAAVALAGPVGFVGLVAPHLARFAAGQAMSGMIIAALPAGAAMVLLCDVLGRVIAQPSEIALGIMLALIGGPGFLLLLSRLLRVPQ